MIRKRVGHVGRTAEGKPPRLTETVSQAAYFTDAQREPSR
jgi:hypothetical protein